MSRFQKTWNSNGNMTSRVYADDISHELETLLVIVRITIMLPHEKEFVFLWLHTLRDNELNDGTRASKADDGHRDSRADDGHGFQGR